MLVDCALIHINFANLPDGTPRFDSGSVFDLNVRQCRLLACLDILYAVHRLEKRHGRLLPDTKLNFLSLLRHHGGGRQPARKI